MKDYVPHGKGGSDDANTHRREERSDDDGAAHFEEHAEAAEEEESEDETEEKEEKDGERVLYNEHSSFSYARSFRLPNSDTGKAEAKLHDGVLTVMLPKLEESKPHRIEVRK